MQTLTNKPFPDEFRQSYDKLFSQTAPLFTVVGDLSLKLSYKTNALCFTKERVYAFNTENGTEPETIEYSEIEKTQVKRMYGNVAFFAEMKNGEKRILSRFTFAVASIADAASDFINAVNEKGYSDELIYPVENAYMHRRSFCPKCGRKLPRPDAECLNCKGKGKMFSKFAAYALPHKKMLIVCMLLSVFTTAMSLIPPYVTGYMVDDVLPDRNSALLIKMILALLGVYILQYSVTAVRSYLLRMTGDKIVIDLKKDIYGKSQHLPMSFYDKTSTGLCHQPYKFRYRHDTELRSARFAGGSRAAVNTYRNSRDNDMHEPEAHAVFARPDSVRRNNRTRFRQKNRAALYASLAARRVHFGTSHRHYPRNKSNKSLHE